MVVSSLFNFIKKKHSKSLLTSQGPNKLLLTSRGYSGTLFFLSCISGLKNSVVAWQDPHSRYFPKLTNFGEGDINFCITNEGNEELSLVGNFLRLIEKYASIDLYCIGHWLNLHEVDTSYGFEYLKRNNIKVINLIRHPIDRTHSNWHSLRVIFNSSLIKNMQGFYGTLNNHRKWLEPFLKKHKVSLQSVENITFIGACLNIFACALDAKYKKYKHVKIESLNNKREVIALVESIYDKKIIFKEEEIEKIKTNKNSHLTAFYNKFQDKKPQDSKSMTTLTKYSSWLSWQQQLYELCVWKSKLNIYYKPFQYELYL